MDGNLKTAVRGCYDFQKLRIMMGNRIVGNFKAKLGIKPSTPEKKEKDADKFLNKIRKDYMKITDGIIDKLPTVKQFKAEGVISDYTDLVLFHQYLNIEAAEKKQFLMLEKYLKNYPVWTKFLKGVKGVGPAMGGVIISEFDIYKAEYPSSMWKYAGLDVAADGRGRSRRKEHQVEVDYKSKDGTMKKKMGITFNPFLKTKLTGVLGASFLRAGATNKYAEIYYNYKNRLENHAKYGLKTDTSKGHRHNMATRYMIKRFLVDLYTEWRALEGLPVSEEYSIAKLGMTHGKAA